MAKSASKCGEERPECLNCKTAGWECPGFTRRFKFIDESHQLSVYYDRKRYIFETFDPLNDPDAGRPLNGSAEDTYTSLEPFKVLRYTLNNGSVRSLGLKHDHQLSILCYLLNEPHDCVTFPIKSLGSFFQFVPARIGINAALDDAITCLCSMHIGFQKSAGTISESSIRLYGKSLRSLRKSLGTSHLRAMPETLCASIVLQLCEVSDYKLCAS